MLRNWIINWRNWLLFVLNFYYKSWGGYGLIDNKVKLMVYFNIGDIIFCM